MSQANSNNTTRFDSSRRRFMAVAAAASAVSAGSLAVAAVPPASRPAFVQADPIFEAIKAHEDAEKACNAAEGEIDRLLKAADDAGLPHGVQVLDHRNAPACLARADSFFDINILVPGDEHEELRQIYYEKLTERSADRSAFWGFNPDDLMSEAAAAEWQALRHFAGVVPTTIAGLLAKLTYAGKLANDPNFDRFDDLDIIEIFLNSLATSAQAVGAA